MSIEISGYDIRNLKPISNSRHIGNYGSCYKFYDGAIKIFKENNTFVKDFHLEHELKKLTYVKVDGVSLPIQLVYSNGKMIGYTMPYFNGLTLSIILRKIRENKISVTEEEIKILYNDLINRVKELSRLGIKIHDIKPDNIIYYDNKLCLVDCDFYRMLENKKYLQQYNIELVEAAVKRFANDIIGNVIYIDEDLNKEKRK